jgi:hypothetical protein
LFEETHDGWVAFRLAEALEQAGALMEALRWYGVAAPLLPMDSYRRRAEAAARRVRARGVADPPAAEPATRRLVIVGCTRRKIWIDDPDAPRWVPARRAYTGPSLPA